MCNRWLHISSIERRRGRYLRPEVMNARPKLVASRSLVSAQTVGPAVRLIYTRDAG
jgi:hypothetical protein